MLDLLLYPLAACILLILIHAYFGLHILERGIIFVDLSLAQFIAVGIAWSCLIGHDETLGVVLSVVFAVLGALILSWSRQIGKHTDIEAFIGVLYVCSLAASFLILDRSPHGVEEFKTLLHGNILWTNGRDLAVTTLIYGAVGLFHWIFRQRFMKLSREGQGAFVWELLFFLSFAVVLLKSVQMAGILQVFAFLIIPALIGRLFTRKPGLVLLCGWGLGFLVSAGGLLASYYWDLPASPLIVVALALLYGLCLMAKIVLIKHG